MVPGAWLDLGTEFYATLVAFRVDRLIGAVQLGSLEQPDMRALALDLADLLNAKIQGSLIAV